MSQMSQNNYKLFIFLSLKIEKNQISSKSIKEIIVFIILIMFKIFIIGTTAVGKTKLSVALAKHFNGEVISCDSKQLYKHASIMTAKVTQQEADGVQHFMVDCLQLQQNTFNRNKYFRQASKALQIIQQRKKMPIIVGGTNYYIQTLLYNLKTLGNNVKDDQSGSESQNELDEIPALIMDAPISQKQQEQLQKMRKLSKQQKFQLLMKYDIKIATKTHRNDEKKITLFLERIIIGNKMISETYQHQTQQLRNGNQIVFWIRNSDKQELHDMVTKRIFKMLDKAGLTEIFAVYYYIELYQKIKRSHLQQVDIKDFDQYSGAGSSIGIKQFKELYLEVREQIQQIYKHIKQPDQQVNYDLIHKAISQNFNQLKFNQATLAKCRDQLILDTKHYCKRQITWIRNRMFVNQEDTTKHFFVLELSHQRQLDIEPQLQQIPILERFDKQVFKRAKQIIQQIQKNGFGSVVEKKQQFATDSKVESLDEWKKYFCQACKLQLNGQYNWNMHISSKKHQKQAKYYQKKDEHEEYIKKQRLLAEERKKAKQQELKQANK